MGGGGGGGRPSSFEGISGPAIGADGRGPEGPRKHANLLRSLAGPATVLGVGVDVAHTPRLLRLHRRYGPHSSSLDTLCGPEASDSLMGAGVRFLRKAYHPTERAEFQRRISRCSSRAGEFLASRCVCHCGC
eukprot:COSAG04_NODE_820_length_10059_cov_4.579116_8_plen_132_part_00